MARKQPDVGPKRARLRLNDPLTPRMLAFLTYIESQGGTVQARLPEVAEGAGMHPQAAGRVARWLELYGAIHVDRGGHAPFATGRPPNRYTALMSVEDYKRDALALREVVRDRLRPPKPKARDNRLPKNVSLIEPDEMALIREAAKAEVLASIAAHKPLPKIEEPPMPYDEAEAWNVAFTADE